MKTKNGGGRRRRRRRRDLKKKQFSLNFCKLFFFVFFSNLEESTLRCNKVQSDCWIL
jgi:hypothetical protein